MFSWVKNIVARIEDFVNVPFGLMGMTSTDFSGLSFTMFVIFKDLHIVHSCSIIVTPLSSWVFPALSTLSSSCLINQESPPHLQRIFVFFGPSVPQTSIMFMSHEEQMAIFSKYIFAPYDFFNLQQPIGVSSHLVTIKDHITNFYIFMIGVFKDVKVMWIHAVCSGLTLYG